ncbi:hypothetical protein IV37_GL000183 [Fructilactobacillus fructivorans]|uniref:hypothetical protein n=1 Tax=Fructilactobacillus fructivorans TaxID=1614 RepID=UPI000704943E|nr:hypothetical protein [Fructilactobacillus fructivorans]KRN13461.1 hypothetical protein IV37_GL000183 [Fructilactobacillus fructivorans]
MADEVTPEEAINQLNKFRENAERLNGYQLYVGVPRDDGFLTMIALVNEQGKTISPKSGKWLCIPTKQTVGKSPRDIDGLFKPKGKNILAIKDKSQSNGIRVMFILRKSVTIPARPFLRNCFTLNIDRWNEDLRDLIYLMYQGEIDPHEVMRRLGVLVVKDLQKTILDFKSPKNAPLTQANKGFDDPLMSSGKLYRSITYVVGSKGEV